MYSSHFTVTDSLIGWVQIRNGRRIIVDDHYVLMK
jgi:hypothetical protein